MSNITDNFKEKVAGGIRSMGKAPDAFLYSNEELYCWDEDYILGIPVFHSALIANTMTDDHVPFIPMWKKEGDYVVDRAKFNSGYSE
jgi:hypothetical protein